MWHYHFAVVVPYIRQAGLDATIIHRILSLPDTYLMTYSIWSAMHELSLLLNYQVYSWKSTSLLLQLYELQVVFRNYIFWIYNIIKQHLEFKHLLEHRRY